jgi:hypothetical protein
MTKQCPRCEETKPIDHFYTQSALCRSCHNERSRAYYKKNRWHALARDKERMAAAKAENPLGYARYLRNKSLKQRYGISIDEYEATLAQQNYCCAICKKPDVEERFGTLCVDHDHQSKANRSLLCSNCNRGLGNFLENPQLLRDAAQYLEHHAAAYE